MGTSQVISVGDELLSGKTQDSNATALSTGLRLAGFPCRRRVTVPDDVEVIAGTIREAMTGADVVVVSGGLGPTPDDLTRQAVAAALGVPLETNDAALAQLRARFASYGRPLTEANLVQAVLPRGANPISNAIGTAPGIFFGTGDGCSLFVLPGVPRELREMFDQQVLSMLRAHPKAGPAPVRRAVTVCGIPESEAGRLMADLMVRGRNPLMGSYPRVATVVLALEAVSAGGDEEAEALLARDLAEIRRRLPGGAFWEGEEAIHEVVARLLMERGATLAAAESLTAGRVSDLLARIPGISACLLAGMATYSNQAKMDLLGVPPGILEVSGAVSRECAAAMAEGARARTGAMIGISSTGIAGPGGGSAEKPVGTVFIALADSSGTRVQRLSLSGDREQIRERAATALLNLLRLHLKPPG